MKARYETRTVDFYYRNDRGGTLGLGCSPHLHYHVEILYILSGRAHAYVDSELFTVEKGDMLVVFPNKIHRFVDDVGGCKYMIFIINPKLVPEFEEIMSASTPETPLIKNAVNNTRLDSVTRIVAGCRDFPEAQKDTLMKGYLLSFFAEFMSMMKLGTGKNDDNQAMKTVVLYCSQNFTKDLSLSTLERELHLSKYYISHLFGDKLGIRFNDYINSLRISESCRLLRTTDYSITEVSDAAGFGTLRTFNRAFIKQMGVSPSDYRKNNKGRFTNVSMPPVKVGENGYMLPEKKIAQKVEKNIETRTEYYPLPSEKYDPPHFDPCQNDPCECNNGFQYNDGCECNNGFQYNDGCECNNGFQYNDGCECHNDPAYANNCERNSLFQYLNGESNDGF